MFTCYFLNIPKFSITDVAELIETHGKTKTLNIIEESISESRNS